MNNSGDPDRLKVVDQPGRRRRNRHTANPGASLVPKKEPGTAEGLQLVERYRAGAPFSDLVAAVSSLKSRTAFKDRSTEENWLVRRRGAFEIGRRRLEALDEAFRNLVDVGNRDNYEFTHEEIDLLIARVRAWADVVEISLESGNPIKTPNLPELILDERHPMPAAENLSRGGRDMVPW